MKDIIVTQDIPTYLKENNITIQEWTDFAIEKFNLLRGDQVFYESNKLGYRKNG